MIRLRAISESPVIGCWLWVGLWVIAGHVISVWIKAGLGLSDADREIHRLKDRLFGNGNGNGNVMSNRHFL